MQRATKLTIILGANGTGKTTLLKQIIKSINQNVLIVTPDAVEWLEYKENPLKSVEDLRFKGVNRHIFNPFSGSLEKIDCYTRGAIVFDDCRSYLKSQTNDVVHNMLVRRRQKMIDTFAVGHGFTEVPPVFFTFASDIILFKTADNIAKRKDCLKDFSRMAEAQERVNSMAIDHKHYFEHIKFLQ